VPLPAELLPLLVDALPLLEDPLPLLADVPGLVVVVPESELDFVEAQAVSRAAPTSTAETGIQRLVKLIAPTLRIRSVTGSVRKSRSDRALGARPHRAHARAV
jgi:hypothetical protein